MKLREGCVFNEACPDKVIEFLQARKLQTWRLPAERLHIGVEGEELVLQVMNGKVREYPVRESFFLKLLKWGALPVSSVRKLSIETIAGIMNDLLLSITSGDVSITIEDGEALAITSRRYSEISDLEVIQTSVPLGITGITRSDFFLRVYCDINAKAEIVPGDSCGFGFNILNSETGFRSLSVQHYILRCVCSNGAIVRLGEKQEERSHYRHPAGYLQQFLKEQLQPAEKANDEILESLKQSVQNWAPPPHDRIYTQLRALMGGKVLQGLLSTHPEKPTVYDLFNLITAHARGLEPGRRLQLESLAGDLLMRRS